MRCNLTSASGADGSWFGQMVYTGNGASNRAVTLPVGPKLIVLFEAIIGAEYLSRVESCTILLQGETLGAVTSSGGVQLSLLGKTLQISNYTDRSLMNTNNYLFRIVYVC